MNSGAGASAVHLKLGGGRRIGGDGVGLLEAIDRHGSITAAGQAVGLSYRAAWDAVRALNNLFPKPLVKARAGGRSGGTAVLTPEGRASLRILRHVEAEIAATIGRLEQKLVTDSATLSDIEPWSFVMRTSARNALRGTVRAITEGVVNAEVSLQVSPDLEITAVISPRSVESLGLTVGCPAVALIKASLVILAAGGEPWRTSARNCLIGTVVAIDDGAINSEVIIELAESKTIVATITHHSAETLGLRLGDRATALIKASHVILAVE
ncbi:MAG TPA: TOBE domain-containing protein [Caulobacteraceae bacterium]|nr:TOBE domain-containing protein [Caulobacteraceae bacterium]